MPSSTTSPLLRPAARWIAAPPPPAAAVAHLGEALQLPPVVCQLLAARGYDDPDAARRYLRPRLEHLAPPGSLRDCDRAVERIGEAIRRGERIFVHGDYDVDGMASTALLTRVLRALGAQVTPWVPHRLVDGYDLGAGGVAAARAAGAGLVVTCDCGTQAHVPIADLMQGGIDVIVTDHHLPGAGLPPAFAVVNPRRPDCPSPDKDLAAVGVAYKLALALCEAQGVSPRIAHEQLDLVALATIADVAPLRGENRVLVRYGLKLMAETAHPGLRALVRAAGLDGKALTAGRVGFVLAPRLNAAGRIGDAKRGLALLLATTEAEANPIARDLEELNRERQVMDQAVLSEALRQVEAHDLDDTFGFVLAQDGWHAGVIGIVASRIVEQTSRPAVLVAVEQGIGKGSGRSIPAFDLHAALSDCAPCFERFGGHRAAAGLTMRADRLAEFRTRFNDAARARLTREDLVPTVRLDLTVRPDEVGEDLERVLRHFEPFGVGNGAPTLALDGVAVAAPPRKIGRDGLRFSVALPQGAVDAIQWGAAGPSFGAGASIDVAFRLERDEYRGADRLQLRVQDVRPATRGTEGGGAHHRG
ncbi:MAG TPA: single-stranded-DNA-specific exonuclease RecJ [Gemmatimonadaceae bacterium]|nr:single-stranded-DNA-specific exonuclease RecJ [Gemmatimonadaceae bacterium]